MKYAEEETNMWWLLLGLDTHTLCSFGRLVVTKLHQATHLGATKTDE